MSNKITQILGFAAVPDDNAVAVKCRTDAGNDVFLGFSEAALEALVKSLIDAQGAFSIPADQVANSK